MIFDEDANRKHEEMLEQAMFCVWLKESGEANEIWIEHLRRCIKIAMKECLTEKQRVYMGIYLSGYNVNEIAELRGVAVSTVSRGLNRGIDKIAERVRFATPRTLGAGKRVKKRLTRLYQ